MTIRSHRARSRATRALVASAALLALAACSDDDAADGPGVVEVIGVDFAFQNVPESVPVGTRLTFVNEAPTELHELVAIRLRDEEERPAAELMQLPPEEMRAAFAGDPVMVLLAAPGGEQIAAVGDGTLTEAGRYLLICAIPTGVDPDAYLAAAAQSEGGPPQIEGGPPHIVHGMWAELEVTA